MEQNYKQKFYNTYRELIPKMKEFELTRKFMRFWQIFFKVMYTFIFALFVFFICICRDFEVIIILIFITLFYTFIYFNFLLVDNRPKKFSHMVKRVCFDDLIEVFDFIEPVKKHFPWTDIYEACHDKHGKKITVIDDDFEGNYKNIKFRITEIRDVSMRGKMGVHSIWSGVILVLQFNKKAKTKIYLSPQSDKGALIMFLSGILFCLIAYFIGPIYFAFSLLYLGLLILCFIIDQRKKIILEDNRFHKKYYVEADDQIEARYILTTAFMERLKNLKTAFGAENISCMIEDNQITFAIKTNKDLFEVGNLKVPMNNSKQVRRFYDEVTSICKIIDHFKLNERTGL